MVNPDEVLFGFDIVCYARSIHAFLTIIGAGVRWFIGIKFLGHEALYLALNFARACRV